MAPIPHMPPNVAPYKSTRVFDEATVPRALLSEHTTKEGTWGQLQVHEGTCTLRFRDHTQVCTPAAPGIIPPQAPHQVVLMGPVRFQVVFLRAQPVPDAM